MTDVLLLCAVPVEWQALSILMVDPVEDSSLGDPSLEGRIAINGSSYTAALVEVGIGITNAALSTAAALTRYKPRLAVFAGIAGGVKDVTYGDVVIASKVYHYESGKLEAGQFRARPDSHELPSAILACAKRVSKRLTAGHGFRVVVGPIASGDKLVADSKSPVADIIAEHYQDTVALEMEGSGFAKAIHRSGSTPHALIRGVSDLLNSKAETDAAGWQTRACENLARVTQLFVQEFFEARYEAAATHVIPMAVRRPPIQADTVSVPYTSTGTAQPHLSVARLPKQSPNECFAMICSPRSREARAILTAGVPLSLVVDLDTEPDREGGLLAGLRRGIESRRLVRLGAPSSAPELSLTGLAWMCVRGFDEEAISSLAVWKRSSRSRNRNFLTAYSKVIGRRHLTLMVAVDGESWSLWAQPIIDDFLAEFGDDVKVYVTQNSMNIENDEVIPGTPETILSTLGSHFEHDNDAPDLHIAGIAGPVTIAPADATWLQEDLDLIPISAGEGMDYETSRLDFLKGGQIKWSALFADCDILRTEYTNWKRTVEGTLKNRRTIRLNLFHAPGAGGSTMARRTLFDVKDGFPSVIVHRYRSGETARRLEFLSRKSGLPVLCVLDSAPVTDTMTNDLLAELHASSTSATIVYVARRYNEPSNLSSAVYLKERLDDQEADRFYDAYVTVAGAARDELFALKQLNDTRRNAFYFGLTAFEENFKGLDAYVAQRINDLPSHQELLLRLCCVSLYYGQSAIPEYALAGLVGLPAARSDGFARVLAPPIRSLLWRSPDGEWRPIHHLVAREVLVQFGKGESAWRRKLVEWGEEFARFCLIPEKPDEELMRIAEAVLIDRGRESPLANEGGWKPMFSRLLEDIPSAEGAVQMLATAADLAPDAPHFAAHVARYYAFKLRNYEAATTFANRAILLDPDNHVLHHVLGMVFRSRVFDGLGSGLELDDVAAWVENSAAEFRESRRISPIGNDYAYISEVQLRLRVIDHATRKAGNIAKYLAAKPHPLVLESVTTAEDLLSRVRNLGDARNPSGYERSARADLTALYGDYERALQLFDSLLSRQDVDRPQVRRQIVWTYLGRANRVWRELPEKAVQRMVRLLEENFNEAFFDSRDIRQWWRAIRYLSAPVSQDRVHEVMAYWRESERSVESLYCSYVAYAVDALGGSEQARIEMDRLQKECSNRSIGDPRRTIGFDWLGRGSGVARLVHQSELGGWDAQEGFWRDTRSLVRAEARIVSIKGPQAGVVSYQGVRAFFVPSRAGAERGRDESALVSGYLAFTRDGPRLWNPELA